MADDQWHQLSAGALAVDGMAVHSAYIGTAQQRIADRVVIIQLAVRSPYADSALYGLELLIKPEQARELRDALVHVVEHLSHAPAFHERSA